MITPYLEVKLEDSSLLPDIKKILERIRGIASVSVIPVDSSDDFNETTIRAIEEMHAGHCYTAKSVDDLMRQCLDED